MQASGASQQPSQEAPGPSKAAAPSDAAAIAVNQAMDLQPPKLCLQLNSATQLELLPLQDPTPMVGNLTIHPCMFPTTGCACSWAVPHSQSCITFRNPHPVNYLPLTFSEIMEHQNVCNACTGSHGCRGGGRGSGGGGPRQAGC